MSTLQVSNVHLESTANNRIEYSGSNTVNIYAGGTNVLSANSSGLSSLQVSSINLESTANNRIEYAGSNTVNLYAGGINVLSALSSGLQASKINLEGTTNNRIEYVGSNTVNIYAGGTNVLSVNSTSISIGSNNLTVGTSSYFVSNGNVGIGTSSPSYKLDVNGKTRLSYNVSPASPSNTDILSSAHTIFGGNGGNYLTFGQYDVSASYSQWIQSSFTNPSTATYNLILQPLGGNVGIGTNTPSEKLEIAGNVTPASSNTYDLGTSSLRWRNIYTNDLNLNNGIGDYTIVEGEDDLFLYNNKKGKVYKFALVEVDPSEAPKKAT